MTVNGKNYMADSMPAHQYNRNYYQQSGSSTFHHPCFWCILQGENLHFAFISASLNSFLGPEKALALLNQSLFDYIHPEEALRARSDLVDTFISKTFLGSNIRCRFRRFDVEKPNFQHIFRRASDSLVFQQGKGGCLPAAQNLHETMERKLSLPIIPSMVNTTTANTASGGRLSSRLSSSTRPLPKRLKTILEDSAATASAYTSENAGSTQPSYVSGTNDTEESEYLVANISLYLVSKNLSIMICHYEPLRYCPQPTRSSSGQCDCASHPSSNIPVEATTAAAADASRVQLLLSQISMPPERPLQLADPSSSNSLSTRHVQIYSVNTGSLVCAFPEEGYQRIYGCKSADTTRDAAAANIRNLWKHTRDKKTEQHALNLLKAQSVPNSDPIRLVFQTKCKQQQELVDVHSLLFRWGPLLFVCQQKSSGNSPDTTAIHNALANNWYNSSGVVVKDANPLVGYNLAFTPPCTADDKASTTNAPATTGSNTIVYYPYRSSNSVGYGSHIQSSTGSDCNSNRRQVQPVFGDGNAIRSPAHPYAPVFLAASHPDSATHHHRLHISAMTPPDSSNAVVAPHRQSSCTTLSLTKASGERRFSYPTQQLALHPHPATLPTLANSQQQLAASVNASGKTGMTSESPSSRLATMRQRLMDSNNNSVTPEGQPNQPTPTISPPSGSIVMQHTPIYPQQPPPNLTDDTSAASVQVNLYPPPEANGSWQWAQKQHLQRFKNSHLTAAYSQRQHRPPPLQLATQSPFGYTTHSFEHYHSPIGSAGASPGVAGPPSTGTTTPKKKSGGDAQDKKTCRSCGTTSSPEWRKGPSGHKTLCNACGLRYARAMNRAKKSAAITS